MTKKATKDQPLPATSVRVSESLRVRAKVYAAGNRTSLQAVIDAAVEEYLKKRGA